MNWQCPRCETFNRAAIKYCEVCELAKPPKKAATKTATKETSLAFVKPPDKTRGDSVTKPLLETFKPTVKVADRRPVSATTKPAEAKPVASKTPAPPPVVQSTGGIVIDVISWLALLGGNVYLLYDYIAIRSLGSGSVLLGMVFGNLILLIIIGTLSWVLKWLLNPPDSTV